MPLGTRVASPPTASQIVVSRSRDGHTIMHVAGCPRYALFVIVRRPVMARSRSRRVARARKTYMPIGRLLALCFLRFLVAHTGCWALAPPSVLSEIIADS